MTYQESETIELKREMLDDLDKEIIAFLNALGGIIYIGVDDDGKVIGVPQALKDEYDEKVSAILSNNIKPNSRNKIEFFPDKVKVTNPGNIYNDGTIEDIKKGIQSFRNPSLVLLLNKLGYIENYGTGIQRILEAYQGTEHQPEFYVSKSYFMVTLHSLNPINAIDAQNDAQNEAQNDAQKSSIRERVINLINENPRITRRQMAERIGVSKATIERELSKSKDIHFVGPSKTGHWEIIPKKED